MNDLTILRGIFIELVAAVFVFPVSLSFIKPWDGGDERWIPYAVAALGAVCLAAERRWIHRPLSASTPKALATTFRTSFFIGVALAEQASIWGAIAVIASGSLCVYLVGLAFSLVGYSWIAPTRATIAPRQEQVTASGSPLDLTEALTGRSGR